MKSRLVLAATIAFFLMGLFPGLCRGYRDDDAFTEDVDAAIATAKKENKDLFVLFTGSDWCPPCKKLESEVFSKPEFLKEASKSFVLVKLDFPQEKELPPEIVKRNEEWSSKYGISGFPTIAILDVNLRPVAFMGFMEGGPEPFLESLNAIEEKRIRRDEAFEKVAKAKDDKERAILLDQALSQLDEEIINVYYTDEKDQIVKIDENNELQLREKYNSQEDAETRKIIMTDILMISRLESPPKAIAFIDEVLGAIPFPVEQKFEILQIKLNLLQKSEQLDAAHALLDDMLQMDGLLDETRERLMVKKVLQFVSAKKPDEAMKLIDDSLKQPGDHLHLALAKGQLLQNFGKADEAIAVFDKAIPNSRFKPDVLIELVAAKADILFTMKKEEEALKTLDNFSEDTQMPSDLRCESLLHQAMLMREMGRTRPAMLTENRAIELADTPQLKREIQNVVDRLRSKYDKK